MYVKAFDTLFISANMATQALIGLLFFAVSYVKD